MFMIYKALLIRKNKTTVKNMFLLKIIYMIYKIISFHEDLGKISTFMRMKIKTDTVFVDDFFSLMTAKNLENNT